EEKRFADAIRFWQRLAAQLPADDPVRDSIQAGIERAREQLQADGRELPESVAVQSAAQIRVAVDLADEVRAQVQPGDTVFVFARAVSGPPMPLAVKRLTVAELPATVTLSDSDAMMEQMKLSGFAQIELLARVSRTGVATAGEWIGRSQPLASNSTELQQLLIDTAEAEQ